ncbi:MAG: type II secretion system protein [Bacilli bacterium]|nr:type II secretion system protein [Bacilli bacterium]
MNKKAFTLVEMIAVIIVLAVIALISTPLILNAINSSKQAAFKLSAKSIAEAAAQGYKRALITDYVAEYTEYEIVDSTINKIEGNVKLNYDGKSPVSGNIIIDTDGEISLAFYDGTNCAKKGFSETEVTVTKTTKGNCNVQRGYEEEILNGAYPELDSGMIPIYYDGNVAKKANVKEEWYSYENQKWANVILVKTSARDKYQDMETGKIIDEDDILAYLVWIPRFSFKLFNIAGSVDTGNETTIDIVFESKTTTKSTIIANGNYYTHPAFTFGDEELNGIWVGKFETSVDSESTCYSSMNTTNCNNDEQSPRILPNVKSLIYQQAANQFLTAQKFTSDTYGITSESTMMNNSQWGAVAYLSHSAYGIDNEVRINNYASSNNTLTGCGSSVSNDISTASSTCDIIYGTVTDYNYPQSTTGNITGIFDMAGGTWEYVLGMRSDANDVPYSGVDESNNSGFNGNYSNAEGSLTTGINYPLEKYYNSYPSSTSCNVYKNVRDAIYMVRGWYGDIANCPATLYPWYVRGGYYSSGIESGIFDARTSSGRSNNVSFRTVILVNK